MKKVLVIAACLCAMAIQNAYAQGSVNFANRVAGVLDQPVFDIGGAKLEGGFAQLLAGASASSLAPVGEPQAFRTGAGAGYWLPAALTIPGVAAGSAATIQVRAWKGAAGSTYDGAAAKGESAVFTIAATGGGGAPPAPPAAMAGFTSFTLVPEPSMIALGALAAAALLLRRRS